MTRTGIGLSVTFLALTLALAGCGDSNSPVPGNQRYFFEIEYINHAWGTRHNGYVFDHEGKVFAYDHGNQEWKPQDKENVTAQELEAKFSSNRRQATFVSPGALAEMIGNLKRVDPKNLSDSRRLCADAGATAYRAWIFNHDSETYQPLLLRLEGDHFQANLSPEADTVYEWLDSTVHGDLGNCEPRLTSRP